MCGFFMSCYAAFLCIPFSGKYYTKLFFTYACFVAVHFVAVRESPFLGHTSAISLCNSFQQCVLRYAPLGLTLQTLNRFLTYVIPVMLHFVMLYQRGFLWERFLTYFTQKWFLAYVHFVMLYQRAFLWERFLTYFTQKWFLSCVHFVMLY